jgi:hypothetical protein
MHGKHHPSGVSAHNPAGTLASGMYLNPILMSVSMRFTTKPVIAVIVVVLALTIDAILFGGGWRAIASEDVKLLPSEQDAAYAASLNIKTESAISSLNRGEEVTGIWDTFGKDYWACYVRTSTNQYVWVLCTSLKRAV